MDNDIAMTFTLADIKLKALMYLFGIERLSLMLHKNLGQWYRDRILTPALLPFSILFPM